VIVFTSSSAMAERPCCRVGQFLAKSGRRSFSRHYRFIFNHFHV